ncbi:MAG: hypothetical protein WD942_08835 [Dehalococcoidia bacterium]
MPPGRPTNQLYHGPAVDDDGALHHHVHVDDDEVASLTSRLRRTRAEMPVSPELVEIAAAWQQIDAQIEGIDFGRRIELLRYRDPLKNERESLSDRIERLQRRLEQEGSGFPLRRRQKLVEELEGELEATVTRLAQVEDRLASVQAAMAGLPDNREVQEMYGRRDQLDAQLRREADARVRGFRTSPPPYLVKALGSSPAEGWSRERWEHVAAKIEHHRLRWQITDRINALGVGTGDRRMQQPAADLHDDIRRTVEALGHGCVRQRVRTRPR